MHHTVLAKYEISPPVLAYSAQTLIKTAEVAVSTYLVPVCTPVWQHSGSVTPYTRGPLESRQR